MNSIRKQQHPCSALICGLTLLAAFLVAPVPVAAQEDSTLTGTVVSSSRNTVTIRTETGRFHLFTFERGATKPASLSTGSRVRVVSSAGDDGVRVASRVTVVEGTSPTPDTVADQPIPQEVRRIERDIERQVRRFRVGVRAGMALDPELVLVGVQAQLGPFFHPDVFFRPNVEFGWGEVTSMFALNPDIIFRLPVTARTGRWSSYVGFGPGFNFLHQNFQRADGQGTGKRIDFGDFKSDVGLNIFGGLTARSGMFVELRTTVYSDPSPTLRMVVGYTF